VPVRLKTLRDPIAQRRRRLSGRWWCSRLRMTDRARGWVLAPADVSSGTSAGRVHSAADVRGTGIGWFRHCSLNRRGQVDDIAESSGASQTDVRLTGYAWVVCVVLFAADHVIRNHVHTWSQRRLTTTFVVSGVPHWPTRVATTTRQPALPARARYVRARRSG